MVGMVDGKRVSHARFHLLGRIAIAAREKTPCEDAPPPFDVVEPGARLGRQMAPLLGRRIAQDRPPLCPSAQRLGKDRPAAPLGDQAADVEAPVGMEVLHSPGIARPLGPLGDHLGQMGGTIGAGTCRPQMPDDGTRGDDQRGAAGPPPMPEVLGRALLRWPRGQGRRRVRPWSHRPPGRFIGAENPTTRREAAPGLEREGTPVVRLGLAGRSVAVEPIDPALGLAVGRIPKAPEAGATPGPGAPRRQSGHPVGEPPAGGGAGGRRGLTGGHRHHLQTRCGGKSAAADPSAAPLGGL
jgi:hypothetical protein